MVRATYPLSPDQLKAMRRVGRPPLGDGPRQLIAIRVDPGVLDQFRKEARRRRIGYQTLINEVLAQVMGVHPLLPDETCWFLAIDFDNLTKGQR